MNKETVTGLKELFKGWCAEDAVLIDSLPESGSARKYFRISGAHSHAIGVYNPDHKENEAFIYLSRHLKKKGVNVPEVWAADMDKHIYLEEDLGDTLLYNYFLENSDDREALLNIYKSVIREMPVLQVNAAKDLDFTVCYPRAAFDRQSMIWDLHYFKSYFLKLTGVRFYEQDLEDDFNALIDYLLQAESTFFMFRDFQTRNIMLHNGKIYFIDYQGGRRGALQYDLASLLFEAKTSLSPEIRDELLGYYVEIFSRVPEFRAKDFVKYYPGFVLIRMLQALGAYGYRGYFERKHFFLQSIPAAVKNLEWFVIHGNQGIDTPQLLKCFDQIITSSFLSEFEDKSAVLTLRINSFAFKNGIPPDNTGNGGGFVFDCRALPNPGRLEKYKEYTGKDLCIIEFLGESPEVKAFIRNAYHLVEASVKNYRERNMTDLMVNFGCTGGQHRSVYCAEEVARLIQHHDLKVVVRHRELDKS